MATDISERIERARIAAGLSQRSLAEATGISQPTLSRIISGDRVAKLPELIVIAWATGHTVAQLTGTETVAGRVRWSARATSDSGIAHAVVAAESGQAVTILMDDGLGSRIAITEIDRLDRQRRAGHTVGSVQLINTLTILESAAGGQHIPDRTAMRAIYARLRCLDDGLPPIEHTNLMAPAVWC